MKYVEVLSHFTLRNNPQPLTHVQDRVSVSLVTTVRILDVSLFHPNLGPV